MASGAPVGKAGMLSKTDYIKKQANDQRATLQQFYEPEATRGPSSNIRGSSENRYSVAGLDGASLSNYKMPKNIQDELLTNQDLINQALGSGSELVKKGGGERFLIADIALGTSDAYLDSLTGAGLLPESPTGEWEFHRERG